MKAKPETTQQPNMDKEYRRELRQIQKQARLIEKAKSKTDKQTAKAIIETQREAAAKIKSLHRNLTAQIKSYHRQLTQLEKRSAILSGRLAS